jgi:hypothetical protein
MTQRAGSPHTRPLFPVALGRLTGGCVHGRRATLGAIRIRGPTRIRWLGQQRLYQAIGGAPAVDAAAGEPS